MRDALIAAQSWGGVRPTSLMSTGIPTTGDWSEADRLLAVAKSLDEQDKCPCGCGFYRDESIGEDNEGWFDRRATVCWARAAMDRRGDEKAPPGELVYAVRAEDGIDED